ncbi:hypothetical protein [Nostoc sp. EfeVER01]|uniref:hypothetical protein n=1 Tax=Nostoc sp. EfeVER01 TaxID=3075406 RepID=UPI00391C219E
MFSISPEKITLVNVHRWSGRCFYSTVGVHRWSDRCFYSTVGVQRWNDRCFCSTVGVQRWNGEVLRSSLEAWEPAIATIQSLIQAKLLISLIFLLRV